MTNSRNELNDNSNDLLKIFAILWAGKFTIIISILIAIFFTSVYLNGATRKYTVEYKFNPVSEGNNMSSLSNYSGLASLAGIELPTSSGNDFHIFKELLSSVDTAEKIFKNKDLIKNLFSNEWNEQLGIFSKHNIIENNNLLGKIRFILSQYLGPVKRFLTGSDKQEYIPPNPERLIEFISKNIKISEDKKTGILNITSQTSRPKDTIMLIVEMTFISDAIMRDRYVNFSKEPLLFYKQKLSEARSREHREALAQLIAKEEQKLMLASSSKYFAAEPLTKPNVSLYPTSPKSLILLILSVFFGLFIGIFFTILRTIIQGK